jgi:hypothetical protein
MDPQQRKIVIILVVIIGGLIGYHQLSRQNVCQDRISYADIALHRNIDRELLFRKADSTELQSILTDWNSFDLDSDSSELITSSLLTGRKLDVFAHYAEGHKHYGAVIFPRNYDPTQTYSLTVFAAGLDQTSPSVNVNHPVIKTLSSGLPDHFIAIPSYRGQSLVVGGDPYCSDGFFGDAYDGATDDALRFMYLCLQLFEGSINLEKLNIFGGSRGGLVALLAGIRYPGFNLVIDQTGPTFFLSKKVYNRYGLQYKYQFLSKAGTIESIRKKMIASSPAYFVSKIKSKLLLIYGKHDNTVPFENADSLTTNMRPGQDYELWAVDGGHNIRKGREVVQWIKANE